MNNTKKNYQRRNTETSKRNIFPTLRTIAAIAACSIIQPAFAVDRTWFGGTGDFEVDTNWSPIGVPGSGDRAIISSGNSTLSLNTAIAGLSFSGGILGGMGNLAINGAGTWTQGIIRGEAATTFNSTLDVTGDGFKEVGDGRIVNASDTTWGGNSIVNGNILSIRGGTFNNTGTFTDTNAFDDQMVNTGNFNNSGTYNKQNNTISNIGGGIAFNNTGVVNVNAGTLRLFGDSTHTGSYALSAGSTLNVSGGIHNFNGATIGGAGTFQISSGNIYLNGGSYTAPFLFSGGVLRGEATSIDGAATWAQGVIWDAGTTTFNSTLDVTGDGFKEVGAGRIVNAHDTTWGGNSVINGNTLSIQGGTFNNTGTFTDTNAFDDQMVNTGTFNNSGTYNKQNNTISNIGGGIAFNNTGVVNVNAGTLRLFGDSTHTGSYALSDGSTLNLSGGIHNFNGATIGGAGTFQISSGNIYLNGGSYTAPFLFSGGVLRGEATSIDGAATWAQGVIWDAGTTTFNSTLDVTGDGFKEVGAGRIVNAHDTTWGGNSVINGNTLSIQGGTFNNTGTFTDTNAFDDQMVNTGTFNNSGTYNKQNDTVSNIGGGISFNNPGVVNVQAGVLNVAHAFTNAGTVNISAGGTFQASCGGADCFVNTGIMQGNGTIQTAVNNELVNSGAINPGDGIGHLTIDGDLNQTSDGVINFELASLSNFDQLAVTNDVTLGGEIAIWNLGYTPVVGDSFVVATFDENIANSTFGSVSTHDFGAGVSFKLDYHEHNVTVTVVPEPEQYALFLAGLALMGMMARRRALAESRTPTPGSYL